MRSTNPGPRTPWTPWTEAPAVIRGVLTVRFVAGDRRLPVLRLRDAAYFAPVKP